MEEKKPFQAREKTVIPESAAYNPLLNLEIENIVTETAEYENLEGAAQTKFELDEVWKKEYKKDDPLANIKMHSLTKLKALLEEHQKRVGQLEGFFKALTEKKIEILKRAIDEKSAAYR